MAENDNDPITTTEYIPELHGKITSWEDVYFEPEGEEPFTVLFTVGAEKDQENAKEINVPFVKVEEWSNEEELPFDSEDDYREAAKKYFERHYSEYMNDEGKKSLRAQMFEAEEAPAKKPTRTEVVDQIKHFLQEKY
jgi:hypothetical protein